MLEVFHSPRLEDLADQLAEQLRAQRRRQVQNILRPITVVVGHLGIARWLEQRIATHFGIFANVRFVLTGEWLNAEMARFGLLEKQDAARFSLSAMTWALYALLKAPERFGLGRQALLERERFQLAAKLARLFSEYLIYRREWLLDFEQEAARAPLRDARVESGAANARTWQARLWCALSARLGGAHRAAKFYALLNAIKSSSASAALIEAPSYFFGLNHLPPDVLTLLGLLSETASVQIYFPNPCVEYWADVVRERFLVQRRLGGDLLGNELGDASGFDHFDVGHPLLASLGGHGQAYFAELSHATEHFTEVLATTVQTPAPTLLAALQYGISHLQPDFAPATLRFESSIQVLNAHSIVDELTRVKAILFAALVDDPELQLEEIAIMTPSLSRYAPLLPAVFGAELCAAPPINQKPELTDAPAGARAQSALRYSVLDLASASASPLLHQLMQAPDLRWEPTQLLALLSLAEVAQHFALEADDLLQAQRLLARAHIAFGFNDAHRQQLLAVASAGALTDVERGASLHTWEAGLERLLFGYLQGNQTQLEEPALMAQLWPVPDMDVGHAPILSALVQLIRALRVFNFGAQRNRTLPEWTRWLERQIFAVTGAPPADPVRALLSQFELDAVNARLADPVSFVALREAFNAASTQANSRRTPALGAICVCGLVPMRALPFKVVCILGLNEAEFPKPEMPDSLNLMRANGARRPGDRSRVQEDRYLFLEAIMAARSQLVLSYQGLSSDGSARQPGGVLNELLAQMERQFKTRLGGTPWLSGARTPLRNSVPREPGIEVAAARLPEKTSVVLSQKAAAEVLNVHALLQFWQQPLGAYVQQRLGLAVQQADADAMQEAQNLEPLSLATQPIERIEARLLAHALDAGSFPQTAPPWLGRSGLLPSGALGVHSYASIEEACRFAWLAIKDKFPELLGAKRKPVRVDFTLGTTRLVGHIPDVYQGLRACVCVSSKALHGAQRWRLLLRVLLLRASAADIDSASPPWRALHLGPNAAELSIDASPSQARAYLENLLALRRAYLLPATDSVAQATPPPWFWPKLSYTAFAARADAHAAVLKVIEAGRDYELANSGLKFWRPNAAFFAADSTEFAQFLALAQSLFAPFAPSTQPINAAVNASSDAHLTAVADLALPKSCAPQTLMAELDHASEQAPTTSAPSGRPITLDLEQFGHDDATDFTDEY